MTTITPFTENSNTIVPVKYNTGNNDIMKEFSDFLSIRQNASVNRIPIHTSAVYEDSVHLLTENERLKAIVAQNSVDKQFLMKEIENLRAENARISEEKNVLSNRVFVLRNENNKLVTFEAARVAAKEQEEKNKTDYIYQALGGYNQQSYNMIHPQMNPAPMMIPNTAIYVPPQQQNKMPSNPKPVSPPQKTTATTVIKTSPDAAGPSTKTFFSKKIEEEVLNKQPSADVAALLAGK